MEISKEEKNNELKQVVVIGNESDWFLLGKCLCKASKTDHEDWKTKGALTFLSGRIIILTERAA